MLPSTYDKTDDTRPCPECQAWMLPLSEYELCKNSEGAALETDAVSFYLWGFWSYLFNYISDTFMFKSRQDDLAMKKRQILPNYPNSLVCTRCLHIIKRS